MKKENKSSIFLSVIAVIILICTVLLLALAVLSFISAPKNQSYYDFIKDHGSFIGALIGGLIGFAGVIWLVWNQKRETEKILSSNFEVIRSETFEAQRIKALDCALSMRVNIYALNRLAIVNNKLDDSNDSTQKLYDILKCSYQLSLFLNEVKQSPPIALIVEYTNLYNSILISPNSIKDLPRFVIGHLNAIESTFDQSSGLIAIDDVMYCTPDEFISCYDGKEITVEDAIKITRYAQLYIGECIIPLIIQKVMDKKY